MNPNYRPANIEFDVDGGIMPMTLGVEFGSEKEAFEFVGKHFVGINTKARVQRYMDGYEKTELRRDYGDLLEQKIPMLERELSKARAAYDDAKKAFADASELVSATTNEAKAIAVEVKRGVKEIELDDMYTWRVPVGDRYFYYTYIDNQIKLCKVQDIPEHERQDLFNAAHNNERFFSECYPNGLINAEKFEVVEEATV